MSQSSVPDKIDHLEDEITSYENLLCFEGEQASGPDPETVAFYEDHIKGLRNRLRHLKRHSQPATPSSASSVGMPPPRVKIEYSSRPASSNSTMSNYSVGSEVTSPQNSDARSPIINLPTRKRQAAFLDTDYPEAKSLRHSPDASPAYTGAPSPAPTNNSSDFDFGDLEEILGPNWSEKHKETIALARELQEEQEKKQQQEEADEAFARSLQQQYANPSSSSSFSQNRPQTSGNSKQTFLSSKGAISRQMAPPSLPQRPIKPEPQQTSDFRTQTSLPQSPLSLSSDSESEFEEIPASEFVPNFRMTPLRNLNAGINGDMNSEQYSQYPQYPQYPRQVYPHAAVGPSMPGAFPGSSPFEGLGGSSVYHRPFDPTNLPPLGRNFSSNITFGGQPMPNGLAAGLPGSHATPIDVESYATRLRDYYGQSDKTEEEIKALLQHIRPDQELKPEERPETPHQMSIKLMEHQKLGLGWMQKMEDGSNKGGILADDMGLGKTIQALALIVSRPPPQGEHLPTLIVAPVSLLIQWSREAQKVMRPHHYQLKVFTLHGDARRTSWRVLKDQDIILTTYGFLASELKRKLVWQDKVKRAPGLQPTANEECPVLGDRSRFNRVILDEAQWIKNKSTKAAAAAYLIDAKFRWCMTGTPMQNRVEELYSLIKFCRIRPYNHSETFSRDFTRGLKSPHTRDKAMRQLQVLCKAILLRRTKTSKIDGKPILQLPPKTITEARAVFTEDERHFYIGLQDQTQIQFNKYLRAGSLGRNYSNALVLLLRLRQACCHPHLIKDIEINTGGVEGLDLIQNARELMSVVVDRLRLEDPAECPVCMEPIVNPLILAPCGHSLCEDCLSRVVDQATTEGGGDVKCVHCRTKLDTTKTTDHQSFLRVYCPEREGVEPLEDGESADTDNDSSDEDEDDSDDGEDLKDFIVPDDVIEYDSDDEEQKYHPGKTPFEKSKGKPLAEGEKKKKSKKGKGKGKRKEKHANKSLAQLRKEGLRNKSAKKAYLQRLEANYEPSAKLLRTEAILEEINARDPREKTIIFSGFTSFLDLLEVPISRRRDLGEYVRYDGSMTSRDRNESVLAFTDKPNVRIMLVSLKAGNAGLNLTAANNVIILDPHWNPFVEMQCQDRAHRIGQEKPVTVHRVLIDPEGFPPREQGATVEDRILALQERKRELVESALDENAGNNAARLGVRELGYLFGVNSL